MRLAEAASKSSMGGVESRVQEILPEEAAANDSGLGCVAGGGEPHRLSATLVLPTATD